VVECDVVLTSLGSIRNTEWLEGSGLAAGFWGIGCDAGCRAFDINGVVTDSIFVVGDIARFPHVLYEYQFLARAGISMPTLGNSQHRAARQSHGSASTSCGTPRVTHQTPRWTK
jgi:hypothetical protein